MNTVLSGILIGLALVVILTTWSGDGWLALAKAIAVIAVCIGIVFGGFGVLFFFVVYKTYKQFTSESAPIPNLEMATNEK